MSDDQTATNSTSAPAAQDETPAPPASPSQDGPYRIEMETILGRGAQHPRYTKRVRE